MLILLMIGRIKIYCFGNCDVVVQINLFLFVYRISIDVLYRRFGRLNLHKIRFISIFKVILDIMITKLNIVYTSFLFTLQQNTSTVIEASVNLHVMRFSATYCYCLPIIHQIHNYVDM